MKKIENFFSKYPDTRVISWFKKVCIIEAITCLLLYGIAMVWKRTDPEGLYPTIFIILVGNIHGLFFSAYLLLCIPIRKIYQWDDEDSIFALLAAFFPFATVWVDKRLARHNRE